MARKGRSSSRSPDGGGGSGRGGRAGGRGGRSSDRGGGPPAGGGRGSGRAPAGGGGRSPDRGGPARGRDSAPPRRERAAPTTGARSRTDRMVVYGRNAVREALRGRRQVHRVWATEALAREDWGGVPVTVADGDAIEQRCGSDGHQGVCAEVDPFPYADAAELLATPDVLIVALDEVTDPQNLGAICRTAESVGATGVVVPEHRAAHVTPAVCKASAGAVEHLPVAIVRNLADFLTEAKATQAWCYGAAAGAPTRYDRPDWTGRAVLVLGAEGRGLRPRVAAACDDLVSLPMRGRIESLNVSATAAAVLYEILQQRLDTST
jgi:23S rRNA (guanosine2251-2'-O)-methyltransferase